MTGINGNTGTLQHSPSWTDPAAVEAWWSSGTQQDIHRPYTPGDVIALRDIFPENVASNAMALKLRAILAKHKEAKTVNLALSPLEMSSQQMLSEAGMETAYVSGGIASFTAVTDPSSDHADYTYDTLPKKVELLHRAQLLNARIARHQGKNPDQCMMPLIADADSGFGQYTTIMKEIKLFVQAGTAGFHIDDLFPGTKRFDGKDGEGWTIVSCAEMLKRLTACRLQLDIMGSEAVIVYRADPHNANRITTDVDPRDRPFILGATVPLPDEYASLTTSAARSDWKSKAKLDTLDDAFRLAYPDRFDRFRQMTTKQNVAQALRIAKQMEPDFYFSSEAARNSLGHYLFKGCIEASIDRSIRAAGLADMLWPNAGSYRPADVVKYAKEVSQLAPSKFLGYNITGGFPADGSQDEEVKGLNQKLASLGYCWIFMPLALFTSLGLQAKRTATGMLEGGLYYYLDQVSRPSAALSGKDSVEWWYTKPACLTDAAAEIIGDCN